LVIDPTDLDSRYVLLTTYNSHDHSINNPTKVSHTNLLNVLPDQHHSRLHSLDSILDHSGTITDAQHGIRTLANAHSHSDLSNVLPDQHADTKVRSKVVDETNIADNRILVYKAASDSLVYEDKPTGGAWKIVKDIEITTDTPLPFTISGLDGDTEKFHYIIAFIYLSDYGNTLLRPNDQTANTLWGGIYYTQTGYGNEYGNTQGYFLSRHDGAAYPCLTELMLRAKSGTARGGNGRYSELGYNRGGTNFSWWNETTSNITSYVIQSSPTGRSLKAGTRIIILSP
jgi:hypothetical protein